MLYLKTADGATKIIVLEAGNLDQLKAGRPAKTPDGSVLIAYTPDPVWLADKLMGCDGDAAAIGRLIDEAAKRPQKEPARPTHAPHLHKFPAPEAGRLSDRERPTVHRLALDFTAAVARGDLFAANNYAELLRPFIAFHHPELGERFLLPSGQTAGRFEDAVHAWAS